LVKNLKENFSSLEKPPVNAGIKIVNDNIEITGEQSGYVFDYQKATDQVINNLNNLKLGKINIALIFTNPEIKKNDTATAVKDVQDFLNTEKITLTFEDKKWEIKKEDLINWLEFQRDEQSRQVKIGFNKDKVLESLKPITTEINVEAKDARFQLANGRVTEFQASQDGQAVNLDESYQKINTLVFASSTKPIELVIDKTQAQIGAGDLNDLGVKELIGRGTSNFAGSPKNRRFNIALGAKTLNGILIAPDEEFSLLKALGPVDGEHGYKQELVIKGDRTKPEFGGGLCQIGTTTFRAALNTGLPITERRNHSYRVVYYEPAGMDATIYDPKPDLKFINDTGRHILFTTKISGDNLIFEFYGTKDGRTAVISPNPPRIYNVTSPGPAKNIETEDLKPGEKKQQEKPHKGADTYFKYTVTYPNGEVKEKEFTSHYVAWPEIWLVGKEPTTPSSTEPTIPTGTETETPTPTPVPAEPPAPATP
jgi:vancomycin resistance protein YoaR